MVRRLLRARWIVVFLTAGVFVLGMGLLLETGTELFPQVDAGQFQILARLPSGTRIERTEAQLAEVEAHIIEAIGEPDPLGKKPKSNLKMLITNIGVLMDWPAAYTPNTGPMDAFILVQLKNNPGAPNTFETVARLRRELRQKFPAIEFSFDTGGMLTAALNMGEPAPIHFQVSGSNLHTLGRVAKIISDQLKVVPGATDVRIAQRMDYPIIEMEIDRVKAALAGVDVEDIMKNLVTATNSSIGFDPAFWIDERNGNHYFIGAQYAESDLRTFDTLRLIPVTGSKSIAPVTLGSLVTMKRSTGPAVVNHRNITRVIDVYASVLPGYDIGSVVEKMEARLASNAALSPVTKLSDRGEYLAVTGPDFKGKGYSYVLAGEVATMRESMNQFAEGFVLALILVYLVLVLQFRSFLDPFIVLLTVPLGLVGVAVMLYFTHTNLSIMAAMGIIMMVGLVVAYSILLVDYANHQLYEGRSIQDAVCEAARVRIRPILMTSLAAALALTPMAIGGTGAEANAPLARAIIGGIISAAFLTLFVLPCLYVIMKRSPKTTAEGEAS